MKMHITKLLLFFLFSTLILSTVYPQNWEWSNHISGSDVIFSKDIVLDSEGNIIASVQMKGSVTIIGTDPIITENATANSPILMKFDDSGILIWHVKIGDLDAINLNCIATDNQDNIYIAGGFNSVNADCTFGSTDANTISISGVGQDTYIAKYNSLGELQWAKNVATSSALCRAEGLTLDSENNILISGFFNGGTGATINFGNDVAFNYVGEGTAGNAFVAKFNNLGNLIWAKHFSSSVNTRGISIAPAQAEGLYTLFTVNGDFASMNTDPLVSLTDGPLRWALLKLDTNGNPLWLRTVNTSAQSTIVTQSLTSNNQGDVFIGGSVSGTTSLTNSDGLDEIPLTSNGSFDVFGAMYNSDGDIVWAKSFGSTSIDRTIGVAVNSNQFSLFGLNANIIYLENDTIPVPEPTYGVFNINFDYSGNLLSQTFLSPVASPDRDGAIVVDEYGNSFIAGFFSSTSIDIGTNTFINGGNKDAFLAKHINIHILPTVSEISCSQGHDGTLGLEVFGGGQEPYSYEVSLVGGDEIDAGVYSAPLSFDNLEAGVYKFTVTDDLGRSVTKFYHLIAPDPIDINGVVTDVTGCYGGENGGITLTVTGGVGEYTYFWDTPDGYGVVPTSQNQSSLTAGTYVVTVTDENGCFATETFEVAQPLQINFDETSLIGNTSPDPLNPNGIIDLVVNNGTGPYTYSWKGPNGFESAVEDLSGIRGGTYILSVWDSNGCFKDTSVNVPDQHLFNAWIVETVNPRCKGGSDGFARVEFLNITGIVSIEWSNGQTNVTTATNLFSGEYSVTLTDDMGTPSDASDDISISLMPVLIGEPAFALSATPTVTKTTCPDDSDGSIQLTVNGWSQPYNYSWSTTNGSGLVNEQKDQYNLTVGSYTYSVTDKYGCVVGSSVNLSSSYAAPSFTVDVSPDTDVCEGTEILVTASSGFSYQFFVDEVQQGEFSTVNTFTIPNPTNGMVVKVVGMNTAGCTSQSDEITIAVTPNVGEPSFTSGASMLCAGSSEVYLATAENAETIAYSIESGTATVNPTTGEVSSADSDFIIRATATGVNGCGEKYVDLAVTVNPIPSPTISTSDRTDWTEGEEVGVTFTVDITDAAYQWQKDGVDLTNATNATYTATSQGEYSVLVTKAGCTGESNKISVNVTSIPTYTVTFNVKDPGQQPIENAQVSVSGFSPVVTNASGVATIDAADGTYSYTITATNYIDYQSTFTVNGDNVQLAINMVAVSADLNEISDIKLFPNPFTNEIRISDSHKVKSVVITNIAGQKVMEVQLDGTDRINTQSLSSGVYLLRIVSHDGESAIYRMVKDN